MFPTTVAWLWRSREPASRCLRVTSRYPHQPTQLILLHSHSPLLGHFSRGRSHRVYAMILPAPTLNVSTRCGRDSTERERKLRYIVVRGTATKSFTIRSWTPTMRSIPLLIHRVLFSLGMSPVRSGTSWIWRSLTCYFLLGIVDPCPVVGALLCFPFPSRFPMQSFFEIRKTIVAGQGT
jgi:hypothetical protein